MARIRTPPKLSEQLGSLGEFIAAQRRSAQLTLRQLAEQAGISNPYLSQIERGLRRPSAEVLQQLSKALRVSAETLYVRAGILDPEEHAITSVEMAVLADAAITERQKRVLIDVYTSFVKENEKSAGPPRPQLFLNTTQEKAMPSTRTTDQSKKSARESDYALLYAAAGLFDALADALRSALAESQERGRKRIDDLQSRAPDVRQQVKHNAEELRSFLLTLPEQFRHLPDATRARTADLQTQANELLTQANAAYSELAGRGKQTVDEALGNARNLSDRAEKLAEEVRAQAGERVDPLMETVQEGVTKARQGVSGRTATETVTPRGAAKASATRKSSTAEAAAKRRAATKKAAATRAAKKASAANAAASATDASSETTSS